MIRTGEAGNKLTSPVLLQTLMPESDMISSTGFFFRTV
jgi:hypothetical protein